MGGSNSHSAAARAKAIVRQPSSRARPTRLGRVPEGDRDVVRLRCELDLLRERAALSRERERGQRALAHDHRVDELHGHVTGVRAGGGRITDRDQPAAPGKALRHPVTEQRESLGLRLEELAVRARALGKGALENAAAERLAHTLTFVGAPTRVSQSRHSSIPSPVLALTRMRSTPGWTESRW